MSTLAKQLRKRLAQVSKDLHEYHNIMYSDDSNSRFDAEHDNLLWHIEGFNETFEEFEDDVRCSDFNFEDAERWHKVIVDEEAFVQSLKSYFSATSVPPPNYIYS